MKKALPANAKIANDAKECIQECVTEFILFITSECVSPALLGGPVAEAGVRAGRASGVRWRSARPSAATGSLDSSDFQAIEQDRLAGKWESVRRLYPHQFSAFDSPPSSYPLPF